MCEKHITSVPRYQAIITENRRVLAGARVLDLASHDGRWSYAALDAGAQSVTGIEVRPEFVEAASKNMATLGIPTDQYSFVLGDMFKRRNLFREAHDVVLCLGIFYHTARHVELLELISQTGAGTIVIDTMLSDYPGCLTVLLPERADQPANGLDETGVRDNRILVGHPTPSAVRLMLEHFGYSVRRIDWQALITRLGITPDHNRMQSASNPVGDYARGLRGTFIATRTSTSK